MSTPLKLSAALSVLATSAMAIVMLCGVPGDGAGPRPATAHGSIVSVLLRG